MKRLGLLGAVACLFLAGCTTTEKSPDGITIEFNALHPGVAQLEANQHCQQFGKQAILVSTQAGTPSIATLFTRTSVSTFECVGSVPIEGTERAPSR
jgi:hypothetical protein